MGIADTSVAVQSRARTWTRLHQHLGAAPGPLTYDMVSRAAADHLGESDDLDWKKDLPQPPRNGQWNEFAKDISAMANTRGGLLIYGVADNHEITGIDWEKADLRQYAQWVRNHVHPYLPDLVMYPLTGGATTLLVVDVPASEMAPHLVHGRSDKDKEQQAFTVPYRDRDHTAWMAEHQIERAYRDRFTRTDRAEEALRRHSDFLTRTITAHAAKPSAWLVAVACPTRPHPSGAPPLSRDEADCLLRSVGDRRDHQPIRPNRGAMSGMGATLIIPSPGLRRWVASTMASEHDRNTMIELHHDGTVTLATDLSWRHTPLWHDGMTEERISEVLGPSWQHNTVERRSLAEEDVSEGLPVPQRLVTATCADFMAIVQETQRRLRLDSTQQITATIYASNGPEALEPRTADFDGGRESTPPYTRRPHHIQPVHTLLPPIADDEETARVSEELSTDLMSQFGL
ncbi:helix-turn-helix domain-containing protein [Streptomyces sp. NPDC094466]|uniref:AlbA family DNA-binding domain-containing protein n=1 Tax=Streptomyces sp. NPDC094466 TaxID=3366065 RepID=UPI0038005DE9